MTDQESILWVDGPREGINLWTAAATPQLPWVPVSAFAPGTMWAGPIVKPVDLTAKKKAA